MRLGWIGLAGAMTLYASAASAQSAAELRAQYQETMNLLNQAESMGVDPGMLASLRESLEGLRQSIEEQEQSEREAASAPVEEPVAPSPPVPANLETNLAADVCNDFGVTEDNYRSAAIAPGVDLQIRTMCGHALEYYAMYKRAVAQGHPEAWKTYDAHRKSALVLTSFDSETRAAPGEGIQQDTKTAVQMQAERQAAQAQAEAQAASVPRPPQAPPCRGCVTPQ